MSRCLRGGVVINHQLLEGKHHYEVQDVLHCKGARSLFRRGDQLLQLNEGNASDFPPEVVAELLRDNSTVLKLHRPEARAECHVPEEPSQAVYRPFDKQKMKLHFSLEMVQTHQGAEGLDRPAIPNSRGTPQPEEISRKDREYAGPGTFSKPPESHAIAPHAPGENGTATCGFLVALNHVSISVIRGRGPNCPPGTVCSVCEKKDCDVHTINVSSEAKSELYHLEVQRWHLHITTTIDTANHRIQVERISKKITHIDTDIKFLLKGMPPSDCCGMIMKVMNSDCSFLIHNERDQYLRPGNRHQRIVLSHQDPESAQVTIFYYKSNKISNPYRGMPVVLNFSKTNYFLVCHSEGNNVLLRIEECNSESLKKITENSAQWRFIFYMKERQDGTLSFESAQYLGWFINNQWNKRIARMKRTVGENLNADFVFILVKL